MKFQIFFVILVGVLYEMNSCHMNESRESDKEDSKRLVLHAETDLVQEILKLKSAVANMTSDNSALKAQVTTLQAQVTTLQAKVVHLEQTGGATVQSRVGKMEQTLNNTVTGLSNLTQEITGDVYTRWGRNVCANDAEIVYRGYIAGKHYSESGSGTDHLCLPNDPTWANYVDTATNYRGTLFGTEINIPEPNHIFEYAVNNQDLPCAVCKSKRKTTFMLPARKNCYPGWTLEYWGYLMTSAYDLASSSSHICLDAKPEFNPHGAQDDDEHLIYPVEGRCGSLPCPPYVNGRELACVVCSK